MSAEKLFRVYVGLISFSVFGTLLQRITGLEAGLIAPISSFLLITCACATLVAEIRDRTSLRRALLIFASMVTLGGCAEIIGLHVGLPFGSYEYTGRWLPNLMLPTGFSFPLMLPLAWFMVVAACGLTTRSVFWAALLATAVDFVMEPVMVSSLRYWTWIGRETGYPAPAINFVGWFFVSLVGSAFCRSAFKSDKPTRAPLVLALYLGLLLTIHFSTLS